MKKVISFTIVVLMCLLAQGCSTKDTQYEEVETLVGFGWAAGMEGYDRERVEILVVNFGEQGSTLAIFGWRFGEVGLGKGLAVSEAREIVQETK